MKKRGLLLGAVGFVLVGCGSTTSNVVPEDTAQADGYIGGSIDTLESAKDDVAQAMDAKNEALGQALDEAGLSGEDVNTNEKEMTDQDNIPEEIDMTLAESCTGATITTNKGVIEVALDGSKAPIAVANFCTLAKSGFYDGVIFHRVIKDFMIQGGDPDGIGTGGPGYQFPDELPEAGEYQIGSLAMANAGPNTNGSQFFIVSGPNGVSLPPAYTLFGQTTAGLDVVEKIQNLETLPGDKPVEEVVIEGVELKIK